MKRTYYIILSLFLVAFQSYAQVVKRTDAEIVAKNFMEQNNLVNKTGNIIIDTTIVRSYNGDASYYVVCLENKGYVIISAYDGYGPVLMYTDSGQFDELDLHPGFESWMSLYSERIDELRNAGIKETNSTLLWDTYKTSSPTQSTTRVSNAVLPLLTATWGQEMYYNSLVNDGGLGPGCSGGKCPVGCVAVAGGMVFHYWRYSILHDYSWDDMPDKLTVSSTQTEINAVAGLLADVGEKLAMEYCRSIYNYCGSSLAATYDLRFVFAQHGYGYGDCLYFASISQLEETIKSELDAGRPLITSGGGGHTFVIDGYDEDMFHFNWGLDGSRNGYFLIDSHLHYAPTQGGIFGITPGYGCDTYCDVYDVSQQLKEIYLYNPPVFGTFKTNYYYKTSHPYCTIKKNESAVYKVYKKLYLQPGFTVEYGGSLTVEIEECPVR